MDTQDTGRGQAKQSTLYKKLKGHEPTNNQVWTQVLVWAWCRIQH